MTGTLGMQATTLRTEAAKEALEASGLNVTYVFEDTAEWDRGKAMEKFIQFMGTGKAYDAVPCFGGEINLLVVNARHMKNVPGRKTDVRDARWIATLLRAGLLRESFIPEKPFRELRHLTRYRKSIVHDITAQKNRIDKFLQSSGFRFAAFLSDTFGASGRNIMNHLIEHGSMTREGLDKCLKTQTRNRIDEILVELNETLSRHQQDFLRIILDHLGELEAHKRLVEDAIVDEVEQHTEALSLLSSIHVISATVIIAEIGTDMSAFPDSQHISSWAGLSPGNNESAGKRKSTHINKGNPYLKSMLCEVAWVMAFDLHRGEILDLRVLLVQAERKLQRRFSE